MREVYKQMEINSISHISGAFDIDYIVDEKARSATLTQSGVKKAEKAFNIENLMDPDNVTLLHHINQAIKARGVMRRDVDYVVKDGQVLIVDEFTGRLMIGRRYSEGLHQAIEAKEHVKVERESKTLATITFQNYFRMYQKISGMTGTAKTEEEEFNKIAKIVTEENKLIVYADDPITVPLNLKIMVFHGSGEDIGELVMQGHGDASFVQERCFSHYTAFALIAQPSIFVI